MLSWLRAIGRWFAGTLPPAEFRSADPPDLIAEVRVRNLPGGLQHRFRVRCWPGRSTVETFVVVFGLLPADHHHEELSEQRAGELRRLIETAVAEPPPRTNKVVEDGLATEVWLFGREPFAGVRQEWNLSAWREADELPAVVRLAAELYRTRPELPE